MQPEPPEIDHWFPPLGPCGFCNVPGVDQRHRAIDAIAGLLNAGEDEDTVAWEFEVPVEAVRACAAWVKAHPDGRE